MNGIEHPAESTGSPSALNVALIVALALAAAIALAVGGCAVAGGPAGLELAKPETTGSIDKPPPASSATEKETLVSLARAHAEKPGDRAAAVAYARGLKSAGKTREAVAVLDGLPDAGKGTLLVERGLLALEAGDAGKARRLLEQASPETTKDWRVLSALGVAEASAGRQGKAQDYFKKALALSPNNPVVLNNMGLSLILDSKAAEGEALLRNASKGTASEPRIGQNLALASALGKDDVKPAAAKTE